MIPELLAGLWILALALLFFAWVLDQPVDIMPY